MMVSLLGILTALMPSYVAGTRAHLEVVVGFVVAVWCVFVPYLLRVLLL